MNQIKIRKKSLNEYKIVIFDLDGTLYYQKPFRIRMLGWLIGYVITHPSAVKDMLIIKKYRSVREEWEKYDTDLEGDCAQSLDDRQYAYVAKKMNVKPDRVKRAVTFFMLETPLKLLRPYRDDVLAQMIEELHDNQKTVVIYSDYPVENKLKALEIQADACYTSADDRIGSMKPDPIGIRVILNDMDCVNTDAVMIGDRYEKDGLAAIQNDVDYVIVSKNKKEREQLKDLLD